MGRNKICTIVISSNGEYVDVKDARGAVLARFDDDGAARNWAEQNDYVVKKVVWSA